MGMFKRPFVLGSMIVLVTVMMLGAAGMASRAPAASADAHDRLAWEGQEWYLHGANLPWYNWGCDFGCGSSGGVVENSSTIGSRLDGNFNNVRWWTFPGDPWQLDNIQATYADFDRALELAEQHDIYYTFTLFSSPAEVNLDDPHAVAEQLAPLLQRYGDHPRILSWEVFNEPEFAVWNGEVDEAATVEFTRVIVDAIHQYTHSYAGVGHAILDGIPMWDSVDLDYFQPHWYDYMSSGVSGVPSAPPLPRSRNGTASTSPSSSASSTQVMTSMLALASKSSTIGAMPAAGRGPCSPAVRTTACRSTWTPTRALQQRMTISVRCPVARHPHRPQHPQLHLPAPLSRPCPTATASMPAAALSAIGPVTVAYW
ncbi:MAG: hypothetical protein U5Q44_01560 [Dehalococcoidia bacterium]|nr:hypothetical protein [Dehalococcoidia bacterium]